jgi:hypothetical protein
VTTDNPWLEVEFMVRMTRLYGWLFCFLLSALLPSSESGAGCDSSPPSPRPKALIREFQKIEDAWSNAINVRDQYSLELVLSPLFVDVSASGDITTRNQQLAQLITGEDKTLHLEQKVITVRMLGDIAVANGTYVMHHKVGSAQVDEKGVFTHVFERAPRRLDVHQLPAHHCSAKTPTQAKKQSNAEMPFHIPSVVPCPG